MAFYLGQRIEVASKEEGFLGSYYSASIVGEHYDGSYIVKYRTLLKSDESGPLVEKINADEIRPRPMKIPVSECSFNDYVDAYDRDGWWTGRIVGEVEGGYSVYFDISQVMIDYPLKRLRKHIRWIRGTDWRFVHPASLSEPAPALGSRPDFIGV